MWMDKLRDQAKAVGGTVLSHLGNHEWMNVIGDWRYVNAWMIVFCPNKCEESYPPGA